MFAPGTRTILGQGLGLHPLGVACWDDGHVFVLDASPGCTDCVTPKARPLPGAGFPVRPGGAWAAVHDGSEPEPAEATAPPAAGAAPAQPAPTAGTEPQAPAAPAAAPPRTPSRLNPRAKPFVMPESPSGAHPWRESCIKEHIAGRLRILQG